MVYGSLLKFYELFKQRTMTKVSRISKKPHIIGYLEKGLRGRVKQVELFKGRGRNATWQLVNIMHLSHSLYLSFQIKI